MDEPKGALEKTERINENLTLRVRTDGLTFGTDAYLLYAYLPKKRVHSAVDLGAGTGVISLLVLSGEKAERIHAIEIQPDFAELIEKNAAENRLSDRLTVRCKDVRELTLSDVGGRCELVFANPPYLADGCGMHAPSDALNIARREIHGTISDFASAAARLLGDGGSFAVVYRPDRMVELFCAMRASLIEPKRLTPVCPRAGTPPCLILCEGRKGGAPGLYVTKPLILYQNEPINPPVPTAELDEIYNRGEFDESYRKPMPRRPGNA